MSLVTRCPSCATTFRVVRDQLRISDGWVRCGRCSHVFDATLDLQETPDPVSDAMAMTPDGSGNVASTEIPDSPGEPEPEPAPNPEPEPVGAPAPQPTASWTDLGLVAGEPWPASVSTSVPVPVLAQTSLATSMEALADFSAVVEQAVDAQARGGLRDARIEAVRAGRARKAAQARAAVPDAPGLGPASSMPVVSLASAADDGVETATALASPAGPMPALQERPLGKAALRWLIAAGVACLLLVLQVLRHERDAIAASHPSWRPVLQAMCHVTGCELSALRQIGAITITGASFAREKSGDGDYRLSFTLRNAAAMPLATPAVAL
jgi:predicted Zn finger-like uncharacterized protein